MSGLPPTGPGAAFGLDPASVRRFGRQLIVPEIGPAGQRRLQKARVLVVGLGGLGTPAALYLAGAGVGELHLIDPDRIEESNLPRQVLYGTADVGRSKVEVAAERLRARDPQTRLQVHDVPFDAANARELVAAVDLVVDASDNFPTRYLVSDACARLDRPDVFAAVHRLEGQVATFGGRAGPCYRCLFPEPPPPELSPTCGEAGVVGIVTGLLGTMQAVAAIRRLLQWGDDPAARLIAVDAGTLEFTEVRFHRRPDCPACGPAALAPDAAWPLTSGPGPSASSDPLTYLAPLELARELRSPTPPTVIDVRSEGERELGGLTEARWIPLDRLPEELGSLARSVRPVIVCQWGGRSEVAARLLTEAGLRPVRVLRGGLDAYAAEVDPTIPWLG